MTARPLFTRFVYIMFPPLFFEKYPSLNNGHFFAVFEPFVCELFVNLAIMTPPLLVYGHPNRIF